MTAGGAPRRPTGSSTSLLERVLADSLDPEYAIAARRRHDEGRASASSGPGTRTVLFVALLGLGLLLASMYVETHRGAPEAARIRASLLEQVRVATAAADRLATQVSGLGATVGRLRAAALDTSTTGRALTARVATMEQVTGLAAVTGPGVEVVLDDGPSSGDAAGGEADPSRVLDRDLQMTANGLWASGAEAVAVNGQRLTSLSAIRAAGDAILVDFRPLVPPYRIDAVGDPARLEPAFVASSAGRTLSTLADTYGIAYSVQPQESLLLPASSGVTLRYAVPAATKPRPAGEVP